MGSVGSGVTLHNVNSEEDKKKKRKKVSGKKTEEENVANKKEKVPPKKKKKKEVSDECDDSAGEEKLETSYASEDGKGVSIENVKDDAEDSKDADFKPPISKRAEKRKKRPPATLVKPKKKRRKGYDSGDELNSLDVLPSTPPSIEDESLIEKRRSGRNVKRKRYNENNREEKLETSYASEDGKGVSIENVKDDAEDSKDADFKPPISKRAEKRKKRPPATLVKPKKKRRKEYDSGDELNSLDVLPSTP